MIGFFPSAYEDELLYSQLARYYEKSGYLSYSYVAENLFTLKTVRPSVELINNYSTDAYAHISQYKTFQSVVEQHTLFPYYARFMPLERRIKALQAMLSMNTSDICNYVAIPQKSEYFRYLQYCPMCLQNDREMYGEGYFHRSHNLMHIDICPKHFCKLINTDIPINKSSPILRTLESCNPKVSITMVDNEIEYNVAAYVNSIFLLPMDYHNSNTPSQLIKAVISESQYASVRGEARNMRLLVSDFEKYYSRLPNNTIKQRYQIERLLNGDRVGTYDVCLLALFLGISSKQLMEIHLPKYTHVNQVDDKVRSLRNKGMSYNQISKNTHLSPCTVRKICTFEKNQKHLITCSLPKGNLIDWKQYDISMLPEVKSLILKCFDNKQKPIKVSINYVYSTLHIPCKRLDKMPLCKDEIQKHMETYPQYWARVVTYHYRNNPTIKTRKQLLTLMNGRVDYLIKSLSYLHLYASNNEAEAISDLINLKYL